MGSIPYNHQHIKNNDIRAVTSALKSYWLTQGPKVREFEEALCGHTGAKYAVCVSSGTAALHIACLVLNLNSRDEVITSPITFVASANCILYCGGIPVFTDIQTDTGNISVDEIERKITKKTKALIPVHFAGYPCDLEEIHYIAKKNYLIVIEDAAHALGAEYRGSRIGSCKYSDMTVFSFHAIKSITTGEGGAVLTNKKDLYQKLLLFRNHGIKKIERGFAPWHYQMQELGFNYRITDFQCAMGISQLKELNKFINRRRELAKIYNRKLTGIDNIGLPYEKECVKSAWHLYPIRLKGKLKRKKKEIFAYLRNRGIGVQVHYIPVYWQPYYQRLGYKKGLCPHAEVFYKEEISIPLYPSLSKYQVDYIVSILHKISR